ncbi:hypothetical protein [Roseivirga seohaensis]|uniref:hypothetical protein n=1 Tax=Roseivirga seohaensis TaxID=1914963 RepID=UPI003BAB5F66
MSEIAVRKQFVKEALITEGKRFKRNQGMAMAKLLKFHTHNTIRRRDTNVTSQSHYDGKLAITLQANVRFLDIKGSKKAKSRKRKKAYAIYNRFAYGHFFSLAEWLMVGLTEDTWLRIKSELNQ